jgi:GT2 family glycosyltransferase
LGRRILAVQVHFDAFRLKPMQYLQAIAWRLRGLRLRSRNRFAELMGKSPRAYALWIARTEPAARTGFLPSPEAQLPELLIVIDCSQGCEGLLETVESLGGDADRIIILGGPKGEAFERVEHPRELADLADPDGAWLSVVRAGDRLAPGALRIYAHAAAQSPGCSLFYADDDLVGPRKDRHHPHFKPAWNPELFAHHDFITHSSLLKVSREALRRSQPGDWVETIVRDAVSSAAFPAHLPVVLHHRKSRPEPTVPAYPRTSIIKDAPAVTAIVPTRNQQPLLRNCIEGLRRTDYPDLEILIVDNGSDEGEAVRYLRALEEQGIGVLRSPGPFNYSALNNAAVREVRTDYLCFLNNDIEMLDSTWLAPLVVHAMRSDIGAVGGRLLYPDHTVQHAGVFIGVGGGAGHAHRFQGVADQGYFDRANLPQRVSAVTGACMVVAREKFLAVGGFDESEFPVAFNDVDLCLKLNARGWQSFYEPGATLIHHESKSRGNDRAKANRERFEGELAALKRKWSTDRERDPFHHPHLSPFCEQFVIAV